MGVAIAARHMNMNDARLLVRGTICGLLSARRHYFSCRKRQNWCAPVVHNAVSTDTQKCALAPRLFNCSYLSRSHELNADFMLTCFFVSIECQMMQWANQRQTLLLYSHKIAYVYLSQMTNQTRVCNYKGIFIASVPSAREGRCSDRQTWKKPEHFENIKHIHATPPCSYQRKILWYRFTNSHRHRLWFLITRETITTI